MATLTLQKAKSMVGKPLNAWGDNLDEYDVQSLEHLKVFVGMNLASQFDEPRIEDGAVIYKPDE